jgi:hypothetical protein
LNEREIEIIQKPFFPFPSETICSLIEVKEKGKCGRRAAAAVKSLLSPETVSVGDDNHGNPGGICSLLAPASHQSGDGEDESRSGEVYGNANGGMRLSLVPEEADAGPFHWFEANARKCLVH